MSGALFLQTNVMVPNSRGNRQSQCPSLRTCEWMSRFWWNMMLMQGSMRKLPFSPPCLSYHWFVAPKMVTTFLIERSLLWGLTQVLSYAPLNTWNQQVIEPKLPFLSFFHWHMTKCLKKKPGSPTELVPTNATCVQDNVSKSWVTDQEMNKPFTLALLVPHDVETSAFSLMWWLELTISPLIMRMMPCTPPLLTRLPSWHAML